jgi:SOS-response transcriptional repressor LexA
MEFQERLLNLRNRLGLTQVQMGPRLGLSPNHISALERGSKIPSDGVTTLVSLMERAVDAGLYSDEASHFGDSITPPKEDHPPARSPFRRVRVVGWAHAGEAANYDELPPHWQETVPTDCKDPKAFAVSLEGDSMKSTDSGMSFEEGDLIIAQPSEEPYSGCFVIARFANDGIIFRRFESSGNKIVLAPLNDRYQVTEHPREDFQWIYPVYGRWTQLWKR